MTVHSIDGKTQTTKLERIGKLAAEKKDIVFNNLGHIVDLYSLRKSFHRLDGNKAVGIDGVTKEAWGKNLESNLQDLLKQIRQGGYRPKPARLVEIPKEDESTRPLAISCFQDKIAQQTVADILTTIYEPLFLSASYGYRPEIDGHEALRALMKYSNEAKDGATVEIDLRKYFNSIPHEVLMKILNEKISDSRFLRLIERLIRTPVMENGKEEINRRGVPQGSIISPILSNIYLHYVIDDWFNKISQTHMKSRSKQIRFADDMVFIFHCKEDAERFYEVLPKRLAKYGLELHEGKSSVIRTGSKAAAEAHARGERLPSYKFLGFTCYWGQSRNGTWRLKYKSRSDRFKAKLNGLKKYLTENLNTETQAVVKRIIMVVQGWGNYHAISDNQKKVSSFIYQIKRILFKWRNRKGGRRKLNWSQFSNLLTRLAFPETFKTKSMFAICRS
ncbi:MAG TPA: group II intron reverse transcriptase/maturase [Patescibacteria group bacterium]|nr:group II intron reverse transcriptase/maturase [Patescibacteria group bacterium]